MRIPVLLFVLLAMLADSAPGQPDSLRVMPLGDSITEAQGGISEAQPGFAGYRYWLWKDLESEGYPVDFVGSQNGVWNGDPPYTDYDQDHEGHWGWRTDQILAQIDGWAAAALPDVVLIHLGHNDLWQDESIDSTIAELDQIIDAVRIANPDVTFLLALVIPAVTAALDSIAQFNERIPILAASKHTAESPVLVVDQHTGFDPWLHTYDGVHPNEPGEQIMADRWFVPLQAIILAAADVPVPSLPGGDQLRISSSPNPFNPTTEIAFSVPIAGDVRVVIHSATGRKVATLWDGHAEAGDHAVPWNGRDASGLEAASGVYFVRISSARQSATDKITLLK